MSADELSALPVAVPLDTAGRAFGLGRSKTRQMAQAGTFPCPVKRIGRRQIVYRADLLAALGADSGTEQSPPEPAERPSPAAGRREDVGRLLLTVDGTLYGIRGDSEQVTDLIETSIRERRHTKLQLDDRQADLIVNWPNVTTAVLAACEEGDRRRAAHQRSSL